MAESVLEKVVGIVESNPQGAQALLLYALVSTLGLEKSGCMFKLVKLREMEPDTRALAYELMELMARHGNAGPEWERAVHRIDVAIRNG